MVSQQRRREIAQKYNNSAKGQASKRKYYVKNKEIVIQRNTERRDINPDKVREYKRQYTARRRKTDIHFRLKELVRTRLGIAMRGNQKSGTTIELLGCSIENLKKYLETKFTSGMTWENYNLTGWHIDHITPLDKFDLTDELQIRIACHFTNLQPLWCEDNYSKGGS